MTFDEWIDKLVIELKKKYRILHLAVTEIGLIIDFDNAFSYTVSLSTIKNLWSYSQGENFQWDESFEVICESINREYMKRILN